MKHFQNVLLKDFMNLEKTWEYLQRVWTYKPLERKRKPQVFLEILFGAPENKQTRKIIEDSEIAWKRPTRRSLNGKIESKKLLLFRNGVTWELYNF